MGFHPTAKTTTQLTLNPRHKRPRLLRHRHPREHWSLSLHAIPPRRRPKYRLRHRNLASPSNHRALRPASHPFLDCHRLHIRHRRLRRDAGDPQENGGDAVDGCGVCDYLRAAVWVWVDWDPVGVRAGNCAVEVSYFGLIWEDIRVFRTGVARWKHWLTQWVVDIDISAAPSALSASGP